MFPIRERLTHLLSSSKSDTPCSVMSDRQMTWSTRYETTEDFYSSSSSSWIRDNSWGNIRINNILFRHGWLSSRGLYDHPDISPRIREHTIFPKTRHLPRAIVSAGVMAGCGSTRPETGWRRESWRPRFSPRLLTGLPSEKRADGVLWRLTPPVRRKPGLWPSRPRTTTRAAAYVGWAPILVWQRRAPSAFSPCPRGRKSGHLGRPYVTDGKKFITLKSRELVVQRRKAA